MTRRQDIETFRGLMCVLVVLYHVVGGNGVTGLRIDASTGWRVFIDFLNYVHMPAFALIGGLVHGLTSGRQGAGVAVLRARLTRIVLPFFVVTTLFVGMLLIVGGNNIATPPTLLHAYVFPYGHFWYLQAYAWVVALIFGLDRLGALARPGPFASLFAAAVLAFVLRDILPEFLGLANAAYLLPFFLAGLALVRFPRLFALGPHAGMIAVAALTGLMLFAHRLGALPGTPAEHSLPIDLLRLVFGVSLSVSVLRFGWQSRPLALIGGFSYGIYLHHVFATSATRRALMAFEIDAIWPHIILGVAAGLALPILGMLVVRALPARLARPLALGLFGEGRPEFREAPRVQQSKPA